MIALGRRRILSAFLAVFVFLTVWRGWELSNPRSRSTPSKPMTGYTKYEPDKDFLWRTIKHHYPVSSQRPLPTAAPGKLPLVQASFGAEPEADKKTRLARQAAIKGSFLKSWNAYKEYAWLRDEVTPISGKYKDTFGGWGATLVDSLDTLWMMGLKEDFAMAVDAVSEHVSFVTTDAKEINVFETTIRFLGGLLSAYDLSGDKRLLAKAHDVGDMLYKAFDTPNHLPVTRWNLHDAARGKKQEASDTTLLAEIGSLSMEFTRLSLLTKDPKYYDAVQRISELLAESQMSTKLPGMWSILVDGVRQNFDVGNTYSLGGMADSAFEYLPKMMALLGQEGGIYRDMYERSMNASSKHLFYRPMTPDSADVLFPGLLTVHEKAEGPITTELEPSSGHLTCFTGGMLALGGQLIASQEHVGYGEKLTNGCVWAYQAFRTGVMPETFYLSKCPTLEACEWDEGKWHKSIADLHAASGGDAASLIAEQDIPKGFAKLTDKRYILRPEAIESVFIMYRITGDKKWQDKAWTMWEAIDKLTTTELANSAVWDMNPKEGKEPSMADSMESFWLGETLKYFYLIFSEPKLISLDEWVFNTEAHPFKRLKKGVPPRVV